MAPRLFSSLLLALIVCLLLGAPAPAGADLPESPSPPQWDPVCYRTNEQVQTFLQNIASNDPQVATLSDAGVSWEGSRHLWLLKLTNFSRPGPKPGIFLLAGQRPRDIAGPEILLRYISYLTQAYGVDPEVTFLLDNRDIYLMPVANPDGYTQVYTNYPSWFKNTDRDDGCNSPQNWGTDLNRNYPFHWNDVGVSNNPCDLSYRGPSPLSEPETQHILSAFEQSGAGLVLSLQAPGPSILYPWGWSSQPAPDLAGLDALGWNLGRLNGTSRQSVRSHNTNNPISGILDDTVYGVYGVPAFTLNIGATIAPQCADLVPIFDAQLPTFLYAAKAVGFNMPGTLGHAFGPTAHSLVITNYGLPITDHDNQFLITVTGVLSSNYGLVTGAVYSIDEPREDGLGTAMSGTFGGTTANISATIDTSGLPNGRHLLLVQGKNDSTHWGVLSSLFFTVTGSVITPSPTPQWPLTPSATPRPSSTRTSTSTSVPVTSTRTPTATATALSATNTATGTPYTPTITPTETPEPPPSATPLPCEEYSDVTPSQFFYRAVDWLTCHHIVSGYDDGTFRPFNPATRAQILKMVVLGEEWELYDPGEPTFSDVLPEDWYYLYVETAFYHGIVGGYQDGTFHPNSNVTRGQLSKVIVSARLWPLLDPTEPHFLDVPRGSTFYTYIETAQAHAVVSGYGDGTFRPDVEATRGQLAKMLYVALTQ
jgi:carboxypeptidase T